MTKCLKCKTENQDEVKFCARCGSTLLQPLSSAPTGEIRPGTPKTVKLVSLASPPGTMDSEAERARRGAVKDEVERLEKALDAERKERVRAEEEFEEYKHEASGRLMAAERLRSELSSFRKYGKIAIASAGGLILLLFILTLVGFSGKNKKSKELAEFRPYRDRYDSVSVQSKLLTKELDSLRLELLESRERYVELLAASHNRWAPSGGQANMVGIEMIPVKGGRFVMGCTPEQGDDCGDDEKPKHSVTLRNYSISKYPVTQGQWRRVMGSNPSRSSRGDDKPVEHVSWRDAQEFINRLNRMTGRRYRLPTEAEWEYAARGGANSAGFKYAGSDNIEEVAWYARSGGAASVGRKLPNELGLFDMSGNVYEWVSDRYGSYTDLDKNNPVGPEKGNERVIRGGSWTNAANHARVSARAGLASGAKSNYVGFRLAHSN